MATESADFAKTPAEIYSLASRAEQVMESAKLLEYALREYSGDYRSGFTQLYNGNRKLFDKTLRDRVRQAFESRNRLKNVAKHGEPSFEDKTLAAESFILAAQQLFKNYPRIFPDRYRVEDAPSVEDSSFFEQGFEAHPGKGESNRTAFEAVRDRKSDPSNSLPQAPPVTDQVVEEANQAGVPNADSAEGLPLAKSLSEDSFEIPKYRLPSPSGLFSAKLGLAKTEKFCERMGRSLKAGISITKAWETEANGLNGELRNSFDEVLREVASGGTLVDAVSRHSCFPPMFCEMIRVGEETGRLDQVFLRLADHYRNLIQMRRTFLAGITWPIFQLCIAIGVISLFFVALAILESMLTSFQAPDIFLLGLGPIGNLILFWVLLVAGGFALFVGVKGVANGWFGEAPLRLALRLPLVGKTIKTMCLSRFAWSFGMAIEAGMDATRSIRLGIRSTQNHFFTVHEESVAKKVGQGNQFYESLEQTSAFPEDLIRAVEVGEITGELTESLERLSEDYKEQTEVALRRISMISGMLIWMFVSACIVFLIFLMYMNYIGMIHDAVGDTLGSSPEVNRREIGGDLHQAGTGGSDRQRIDQIVEANLPSAGRESLDRGNFGGGTAPAPDAQRLMEKYRSKKKTGNPVIAARDEGVRSIIDSSEFKKIQGMYEAIGESEGLSGHDLLDKLLEPFDKKK